MPTLVWIRRPKKSGASGAAGGGGDGARAAPQPVASAAACTECEAVPPDSAISASSDPVQGASPPAISSKRCAKAAGGGTKRKRQISNRAKAGTTAAKKRKSKTTSDRDLPTGVRKKPSGKFQSTIWWGNKQHNVGTFDTSEQASAAFMLVRRDLDDAKLSVVSAVEVKTLFDEAKKNALASFGGFVPEERDLPRGVKMLPSGKFRSNIWWGGKDHYIGSFDTPEQASAAYMSVRKYLDDAKLSALGVDEAKAAFVEVKKKALESFGGLVSEERDLPTGVYKLRSGKFKSQIHWSGQQRHIGTFDTPEQASAAYMSVRKDLDDAKLRSFGSHEVKKEATFDAAKKKALEALAKR